MENDNLEASRRALLKYYNSQTMTHGGYMIALVVGFATLVSRWSEFRNSFWAWNFFLLLNSLLFVAGLFVLFRSLFWGYLASSIIDTTPSNEGTTIMMRLHNGSLGRIRTDHPLVYVFRSFHQKEVIAFWVIGVLVVFIYLLALLPFGRFSP